MLWQFVLLLAIHWVADFVLQTHWQASNKNKRNDALFTHVLTYTATMMLTVPWIFLNTSFPRWILFIAINSALHFATDYFTSRASSKLFNVDWHNFFVVVGFDQLIHQITLAATMVLIFS